MPTLTDPSNAQKEKSDLNLNLSNQPIFDFDKMKDFNTKSVDLIFEDKIESALEILKKIEVFLEANAIETKTSLDKKILIIILHNLACCYQKTKDFENCISYLEAVIFHFDSALEPKHKIKINEDYFIKSIHQDQSSYSLLGDFILELRFSAKFHLQMCAVLSQATRHRDALSHAKLAALMCEDNLIKTYYLYFQMKEKELNHNLMQKSDDDYPMFAEKIKQSYKIISDLYHRVINIRNNNATSVNSLKPNTGSGNKNYFDSYLKYRNAEIANYNANENLTNNIRNVFGSSIKKDDWIQLLNIGNIMYLSALNYEDLDLDSDPKYELLRDAILEKVVMLTVAYFCIATELRFLSPDKQNAKTNGEFYHYKAVEFASLFLPVSCPIVKHYIFSYYKHYGNDLSVIPEGETCNTKIELVRSEIEQDKDTLTFVTTKKIGYTGPTTQSTSSLAPGREFDLPNNNFLASKTKIKDDKAPKFKLNFMNLNHNHSNVKDESLNNQNNNNNHFNRSNNSNNNSNNNSERIVVRHKAKTDRIKISKIHISKNTPFVSNNNHLEYASGKNKSSQSSNAKKKGSMTDRGHSGTKKSNISKDKCKTQREFHSTELIFKSSSTSKTNNNNYNRNNGKSQHLNINTVNENNTKYIVKIKKGNSKINSNLNKRKENNNATLIDKLLSHSKTRAKADLVSYSSTCSSLNSLIKVLKPKNKK